MIKPLLKSKIADLGKDYVQVLYYNYGCQEDHLPTSRYLSSIHSLLQDEESRRGFGLKPCLSDEEYLNLVGYYQYRLKGINPLSSLVDTSNFEDWISQNPRCVPFEVWERYEYILFDSLNLQFEVSQRERCDLALDIITDKINCDLLLAIDQIIEYKCNMNATFLANEYQCNLLLSECTAVHPDCNLSLTICKQLIECGAGLDFVCAVYDSGCEIVLNHASKVAIKTGTNTYAIEDFHSTDGLNLNILN